jgi:SAM-dependent methyltransferase
MRNDTSFQQYRDRQKSLEAWYGHTLLGSLIRDELKNWIAAQLETQFGYHLLTLGADIGIPVHRLSRVRNTLVVDRDTSTAAPERQCCLSELEALPVASGSVDACLLIHATDLASDSHQLLREINRVLTPNGRLLLVGFNPWSLNGLSQVARRWLSPSEQCHVVATRVARMRDWLSLLDFSCDTVSHFGHLPVVTWPLYSSVQRWNRQLADHSILGGAVVAYSARKWVRGHLQQSSSRHVGGSLVAVPSRSGVMGANIQSKHHNALSHGNNE